MDAGFFCPEHAIHIFEHSRIGLTKRCVKNCKKTVFLPHEPAGERAEKGKFGVTVAYSGGRVTYNSLSDIAGKAKSVPPTHPMVRAAKSIGISFGVF